LTLVAVGPAAFGENPPGRLRAAPRKNSTASNTDAMPAIRAPLDPMPGMKRDVEVAPAAFIAQAGVPGEPLGFSASRFNPTPGPAVFPGESSAVTYGPEYEDFYNDDPTAPPPTASSGEWLRNGCWYVDVAATYIQRSANVKNDVQLAINGDDLTNPFGPPTDMGYQPGLLSTFGRYLGRDVRNRDHSVEFTFLGLNHWGAAESISSPDGLIFPAFDFRAQPPVFNGSQFQSFNMTSDFNSYEFNYRIDWRLGRDKLTYSRDNKWIREAEANWLCSVLGGIRAVFVNESLDWFAANQLGTGDYFVRTHNNLVGPQVGAEIFYDRAYWRLGVKTKAGGLVNWASQSSTVRILDDNSAPLAPNRDEYAESHTMSFVGGVSFLGEYRFRPNFGLRATYDLFWVTSVALAQNQLTFFPSTPPEISDSHSLFYQGFTFGFTWYR
jgi:hypothetical protein